MFKQSGPAPMHRTRLDKINHRRLRRFKRQILYMEWKPFRWDVFILSSEQKEYNEMVKRKLQAVKVNNKDEKLKVTLGELIWYQQKLRSIAATPLTEELSQQTISEDGIPIPLPKVGDGQK